MDDTLAFIGQFDTWDSNPRRLDDIQGTLHIQVTGGTAIVAAVSSSTAATTGHPSMDVVLQDVWHPSTDVVLQDVWQAGT